VIPLLRSGLDVHVLSSIAFWPHSRPRHATMCTVSTPRGSRMQLFLPSTLFILLSLVAGGQAHGGHMDKIPEGAAVSEDPIVRLDQQHSFNGDSNQFTHILLMIVSFGMLFPAGMVLGVYKPSPRVRNPIADPLSSPSRSFVLGGMFHVKPSVLSSRSSHTSLDIPIKAGNSRAIYMPLLRLPSCSCFLSRWYLAHI
jgi:hypothetical protein